MIFKQFFLVFFGITIDFHVITKSIDFVKNGDFLKENHVFLEFRFPWGGTFSEPSAFLKESILKPKNLPKLRSKSIKIDLNFHIEIYFNFPSIFVVGGNERL